MVSAALHGLGAALLALSLAMRVADGSFAALVQTWYEPLLIASILILLACAVAASLPALRTRAPWRPTLTAGPVLTAVLFLVPVVLTIGFEPRPLTSGSLEDDNADAFSAFSATAGEQDPVRRNIYQWAYAFTSESSASLVGLDVNVIGFVHLPEGTAADEFRVARFVVACCVADAQGFSLPVRWSDAAALPADTWVRVAGKVGAGRDGLPIVLASTVEPIDAPSNPYIYP